MPGGTGEYRDKSDSVL